MHTSPAPTATQRSRAARAADQSDALSAFRESLSRELGVHRYGLWFENGTALRLEGTHITIEAATPYVAEWINRHLRDAALRAGHAALNLEVTLEVTVASAESESRVSTHDALAPSPASLKRAHSEVPDSAPRVDSFTAANHSRRRAPDGHPSPRSASLRRFEDFVIGESNRLAFAASVQIGDGAAEAPPILFLHGECGVGKTHLIQAICRRRAERATKQVIRYVTAEQFTNEYIASVRDGSLEQFRKRLRRVDLLAIDDVHFFANKTATQAEFLHTIDAIDLSGARVALVSDEHPRHIRKFSQSLVSRFLSGMVVKVERPDRTTRTQLVERLANQRGLDMTTAALDAVAGRCAGSIREIEGAITRLGALVELDGVRGQIGPGTVERLLGSDAGAPTGAAPIRLQAILEAVCARMKVTREDVLGNGRHARTVVARGVVAHLARELTTHSYPEIARMLGRDTHSAVHTAAKRLRAMLDQDVTVVGSGEPVREVVDQLRHDLGRSRATNAV